MIKSVVFSKCQKNTHRFSENNAISAEMVCMMTT